MGMKAIERRWFSELLAKGQLIDAYRRFHPVEEKEDDEGAPAVHPEPFGPFFSWRGLPSTTSAKGRFEGKGMRIDHVLASDKIMKAVEEVKLVGSGKSCRDDSFMASDHCPIVCKLDWSKLSPSASSSSSSSGGDKNKLSSSSSSSSSPSGKRQKVDSSKQEEE
jgi:hypothetical protein